MFIPSITLHTRWPKFVSCYCLLDNNLKICPLTEISWIDEHIKEPHNAKLNVLFVMSSCLMNSGYVRSPEVMAPLYCTVTLIHLTMISVVLSITYYLRSLP